jgi:hypothetical protein
MVTKIEIKLLSLDYRLRMQVQDEINARYVALIHPDRGYIVRMDLDDDGVSRESIISSLSEGSLEFIDTIKVIDGDRPVEKPSRQVSDFVTADTLIR